jgi:hypothetical protein
MSAARTAVPSRPSDPRGRRSAGLLRVRGVTRWTTIGSAATALLLGLGYAHALPSPGALLPSHFSGGITDDSGAGGGAQAPSHAGGGGSHTSTGAS